MAKTGSKHLSGKVRGKVRQARLGILLPLLGGPLEALPVDGGPRSHAHPGPPVRSLGHEACSVCEEGCLALHC